MQRSSVAKERWVAMVRQMGKLGGSEFRSTNTQTHTLLLSLSHSLSLCLSVSRTLTLVLSLFLSLSQDSTWPCYLALPSSLLHSLFALSVSPFAHTLRKKKDETNREGKKKGENRIVIANEQEGAERCKVHQVSTVNKDGYPREHDLFFLFLPLRPTLATLGPCPRGRAIYRHGMAWHGIQTLSLSLSRLNAWHTDCWAGQELTSLHPFFFFLFFPLSFLVPSICLSLTTHMCTKKERALAQERQEQMDTAFA